MADVNESETDTSVTTLMDVLRPFAFDTTSLLAKYPFLNIVRMMLGDTPEFYRYTALFEPMAPCTFMIKSIIFNRTMSPDQTTLAMYSASVASQCSYCIMHCCTILKRNEVELDRITSDEEQNITSDYAIRKLGKSLGMFPTRIEPGIITSLQDHFTDTQIENLALTASAMGYLTSGNDVLSSDLEVSMLRESAEYLEAIGWTSTHPHAKQENTSETSTTSWLDGVQKLIVGVQWQIFRTFAVWGIPTIPAKIHRYLTNQLGASLSVFDDIENADVRVSLVYIICEYLKSPACTLTSALKYAIGTAYATRAHNDKLRAEMSTLYDSELQKCDDSSYTADLGQRLCDALADADSSTTNEEWISRIVSALRSDANISERDVLALLVSLSMCYAPSKTCAQLASVLSTGISDITPAGVMEIVSWTSTLVLLNRMMSFYSVRKSINP